MASIKVRLKKACKGKEVMISKCGGWMTQGHFAIERSLLIEQGLVLPAEQGGDATFYKGLGLDLVGRNPDVSKILEPLNQHKTVDLYVTEYLALHGPLTMSILSGDEVTAFVQTSYIDLVGEGTIFETYISKGDYGLLNVIRSKDERFVVMPVKKPDGARESFAQFAQNLIEMKEGTT